MAAPPLSVFELLSQRHTQFRTRQALLVLGLETETAVACDGHTVTDNDSFIDNIKTLVPEFRPTGDVYWIRTEKQHLSEYAPQIIPLQQPSDTHIVTKHASAFHGTSLLLALRTRLVTELYLVGCMTDLSVYSTALDAAQYGIRINIVEDCLGYRSARSHAHAINCMTEELGAYITTANTVIDRFHPDRAETPGTPQAESCSSSTPDLDHDSIHTTDSFDHYPIDPYPDQEPDLFIPDQHSPPLAFFEKQIRMGEMHQHAAEDADSTIYVPDHICFSPKDASSPTTVTTRDATPSLLLTSLGNALDTVLLDESQQSDGRVETREGSPASYTSKKRRSADLEEASLDSLNVETTLNESSQEFDTCQTASRKKSKNIPSLATFSSKSPGDTIGSGDTYVRYDLMSPAEADGIFAHILHQVCWQRMSHASGEVPRLVCYQGDKDNLEGAIPVYRHPSDHLLALMEWSPVVRKVRQAAEHIVGHSLNHAFIQLYRGGTDFISEHSDKTLDIMPGSSIVNVSFGAQRTMRIRSKRDRPLPGKDVVSGTTPSKPERITERIHLPHNSIFVMGLETNAQFLHGIQPDRRLPHDLSPPELAYNGLRVSITFRRIGTFLSHDSQSIWGQGAVSKSKDQARPIINGDEHASQELINAFGTENQTSDFSWADNYGRGFDVLHMSSDPGPERPMLFLSGEQAADANVQQALHRLALEVTVVPAPEMRIDHNRPFTNAAGDPIPFAFGQKQVILRDVDVSHTEVQGSDAILQYLTRVYGAAAAEGS